MKKGIGTQKIIEILSNLFPKAIIERADLDAKSSKKNWNNIIENFHNNKIDILVGTQSITKGYDFKNCTLVCVIWADLNLHFPIYNATETTLQQLIQVIGRAGRHKKDSNVIIQTFDNHNIYNYLDEKKYYEFYKKEIKTRIENEYPPFFNMFEIEIRNQNKEIVDNESFKLKDQIEFLIKSEQKNIIILGPVFDFVSKVKNTFVKKIYLKNKNKLEIINIFSKINKENFNSKIFFNFNC